MKKCSHKGGVGEGTLRKSLVRAGLCCQRVAVLPVLAIQAENPIFESALYILSGNRREVSMTGSCRGHIPGLIVVVGYGLVAFMMVF